MPGHVDTAQAIYLGIVLLFVLVASSALRRGGFATALRNALIWIAIFAAVFVLATYREDIGRRVAAEFDPVGGVATAGGEFRVKARPDGHFWVRAAVNGVPTLFLVDTGASDIVLSRAAAAAAGIDPSRLDYVHEAITANGTVRSAPVRLRSLSIGPIARDHIAAEVTQGQLEVNLLGMRFLRTLDSWRVEGDTLILAGAPPAQAIR